LKIVAARLVNSTRATDTVVRLGGDEFVVLSFDQPKDAGVISETMQKIRGAITEPIRIDGHELHVTASIGLANYPSDATDADLLLANADAAMYRAMEIGGDNFQFCTPELNTKIHEKFQLQKELRNAVARSEFILHYQPQVDLRRAVFSRWKALIRWMHPELGMISPLKFIPMAEETGLIVPIGDWPWTTAAGRTRPGRMRVCAHQRCVNVSARQFKEKNWVSRVASILRESAWTPNISSSR